MSRPVDYLPHYVPETRPPPPAYARIYPYTLRPVLLFASFVAFLYLVLIGVSNLQNLGGGTLRTLSAVEGVLFLLAAAVEAVGFVGAIKSSLPIATLYARLVIPGYAAVVAAQALALAAHYSLKNDVIAACVDKNTQSGGDGGGWWWQDSQALDPADAQTYCQDRYGSQGTWLIVWLVVVVLIGLPFMAFAFGFKRQLADPASVRVRNRTLLQQQQYPGPYDPHAQAYAMQPYPQQPYPQQQYAPPQGPPPSDPPKYARDHDYDDQEDRDEKSAPVQGASSSSRDVRRNSAAKDSQVTATLDEDDHDDDARAHARI